MCMHMHTSHYLRMLSDCVAAIWGQCWIDGQLVEICMALQGGRWGTTGRHNDIVLKLFLEGSYMYRVTERHLVPCFIVCAQSLNHLGIWSAGLGCTREQLFSVGGECRTASVLVTPTCISKCVFKCISRQLSCVHIQMDFTVSQWCLQVHSECPSM